jgi:hypothetical protein
MAKSPNYKELFEAGIADLVEVDGEGKVWMPLFGRRYRVIPLPAPARKEKEKGRANPQDYFGTSFIDEAEIIVNELEELTGKRAEVVAHVRPPMVYLDVVLGGGRVAVEVASIRLTDAGTSKRAGEEEGEGEEEGAGGGAAAGARAGASTNTGISTASTATGADAGSGAAAAGRAEGAFAEGWIPPLPPPEDAARVKAQAKAQEETQKEVGYSRLKPDKDVEELLLVRIAQSMMVYDRYLKKNAEKLEKRLKEEEEKEKGI